MAQKCKQEKLVCQGMSGQCEIIKTEKDETEIPFLLSTASSDLRYDTAVPSRWGACSAAALKHSHTHRLQDASIEKRSNMKERRTERAHAPRIQASSFAGGSTYLRSRRSRYLACPSRKEVTRDPWTLAPDLAAKASKSASWTRENGRLVVGSWRRNTRKQRRKSPGKLQASDRTYQTCMMIAVILRTKTLRRC